jgi:hypothetical protein
VKKSKDYFPILYPAWHCVSLEGPTMSDIGGAVGQEK